jgi:RNA polymerase sigma-70 factor (ECF subfamily)
MSAAHTSSTTLQPAGASQRFVAQSPDRKAGRAPSWHSKLHGPHATPPLRTTETQWTQIQRAMTGDSRAQEQILAGHTAILHRIAFSILRNKEDAEDAVQEGLCMAFVKLRSFQGRSSFLTWLIRIVINSALMIRRRKNRRLDTSLDQLLNCQPQRLRTSIVGAGRNPEQICGDTEIKTLLEDQIRQLPSRLRAAIQLFHVDGLSIADSSQMLGIRKSTFKSQICRARQKLVNEFHQKLQTPTSGMPRRRATTKCAPVVVIAALLFVGLAVSTGNAQQFPGPVKAVQIAGLTGVKQNTKGALNVGNGRLHFVYGKASSDLSASSIEDVVTGADSQNAVGNTVYLLSLAAPYGSGRFLSLFRKKIDTLTIQYRDGDGALHGAIFSMPVSAADVIKHDLVTHGARTNFAEDPSVAPTSSTSALDSAARPLSSQKSLPSKIKATAIQVEMIQSNEIKLPAEFQIALYENLVLQLEKHGTFQRVYRDGDRDAKSVAGLVVLQSTVRGFKPGSEKERQLTTVAGATSISVNCL